MRNLDKVLKLTAQFEAKIEKLANFPDETSVLPIIQSVYSSIKSNPALKGTKGIAPNLDVSGSIGEKVRVYFQVMTDPKWYTHLIEEPQKSSLQSVLKSAVEQALGAAFRNYEFQVKVGIVS
jgi:hypothetical protein